MCVMASLLTLPALKNIFHFTCSLYLQEHCTPWAQHNITSSLLMEAIHHVKFKGYTPGLCFTDPTPSPHLS